MYVRSNYAPHSRSGFFNQGGRWREMIMNRIKLRQKLSGEKKKESVTQPWYLGVVQTAWLEIGTEENDVQGEGGRLIRKIDCEKRSVFSNFPTSAGSFGTVSCTSWVAGMIPKSITPHEWSWMVLID